MTIIFAGYIKLKKYFFSSNTFLDPLLIHGGFPTPQINIMRNEVGKDVRDISHFVYT